MGHPDPLPTARDDAGPPAEADDRLRRFGEEIDSIRRRVEGSLGDEDVQRVRRLDRFSRAMEVVGRLLLHFSFEPASFAAGVLALWIHKQLQAIEIGHAALHGAYDGLPGAERYHQERFAWDLPIDEASWRAAHNVRHHQYTNVAGRDPDIHFGTVRLTEHAAPRAHGLRLATELLLAIPNFGTSMNLHVTGMLDVYLRDPRVERLDFLPDRSPASVRGAKRRALRKFVPYWLKEYLLFPTLAGPGFLKVALGNWLAGTLRDVYSAATIYCGHVGQETAAYPEGTRAQGRGAWYAMQVAATNNFEVSRPLSILCGGLDFQIEHHLFPRLPPHRLRAIAPEVRAVCERHGVPYRSASWGATLRGALARVVELSRQGGVRAVAREMT
ncbi:MAG: acyl-CoA desaturase [Myxococcales bacterium]|nr:acyl-CoA desaturase [Myxococcales bacterium]